jgi:hypothetical protein
MPMTKKTREDLADALTRLDRELVDRHRTDAELFERLTELQRESGIMHGERPICPFLRPHFLAESQYLTIREAARTLYGALSDLAEAALSDDRLSTELGLSEKELRWARVHPGYEGVSVTGRLDTFLADGGFHFLEYNGENPAGIGDQPALEGLFSTIPEVRRFLDETPHYFAQPHVRLLESLDRSYREFGGRKRRPTIGIVDWTGVDTGAEFEILREYFESEGYPTAVCDPREIEYRRGAISAGDRPVDIFYKRVIIHELMERVDEDHDIFRAFSDGAVCMVNAFRSKVPHKKATFAVLTEARHAALFTKSQHEIIRNHVPWTRRVTHGKTEHKGSRVDLLEHIRSHREQFVLKPNDDYGGHGVAFGWECNAAEWDEAIDHAVRADYVVQERVAVENTSIPVFSNGEAGMASLTVDLDPFLFHGEVEGAMVRLAAGPLVNITQGGGETALAILRGV